MHRYPDLSPSGAARGLAALPTRGRDRRAARVRPYAITGGRTRATGHVLQVETFIATVAIDASGERLELTSGSWAERVMPEMRAIVELCRRMRSVAEIAALLRMPLGVVRVLLSDLADQGRIRVYGTGHGPGGPDRALLERVLSGLRRL
ncbi:DUF742 domain-containing protein [Actinacidiphila oryziradicis]|jgi:hypothetical protein|uniref:DUF742 domain-containing protein n=1 Tax=Actinacidiphila oryziradicis TaxID=2571141 RepID=A0A4U0RSI0_9ACTN|nr:DUF742 domain-containing protein [Actinacidiphila oryziradicis]MCW2874218.1 hypothetical protein [Actinacidiphila oryziradicis]TJZ99025.1 DUF742 domain-containing protein [Actinacidiphila oryziradicis]